MNAPFHIGQKVVALKGNHIVKKGKIYEVTGCLKNKCKCGGYVITIGIPAKFETTICTDCDTGGMVYPTLENVFMTHFFAPVQTTYADATAEILEKFSSPQESPDKIIQPQKATV